MRVIKLERGEIPEKGAAIYPNIGLSIAVLSPMKDNNVSGDKFDGAHLVVSQSLVPVEIDGIKYLVPFKKTNMFHGSNAFFNGLNDFITSVNVECQTIISNYIFDESIVSGLNDGRDLYIYKYK